MCLTGDILDKNDELFYLANEKIIIANIMKLAVPYACGIFVRAAEPINSRTQCKLAPTLVHLLIAG